MKKLMTLMLGLSLGLGTVAISFAQDTGGQAPSGEQGKTKKKGKKKKSAEPKSGGSSSN